VTTESSRIEQRTIEFRIKNEPFTPYTLSNDPNNWTVNYYYNIRWKGHYETDWNNLYLVSDGYPTMDYGSDYTVLSYECSYSSETGLDFEAGSIKTNLPIAAEVDFQLESMIGYISRQYAGDFGTFSFPYVFKGESSGWSDTQTITIDAASNGSSLSSQNPSATSEQSGSQVDVWFGLVAGCNCCVAWGGCCVVCVCGVLLA